MLSCLGAHIPLWLLSRSSSDGRSALWGEASCAEVLPGDLVKLNKEELLYMTSQCLCQQKAWTELRLLPFYIFKGPHCLRNPFTQCMSPPRRDGSVGESVEPYMKRPVTPLPPAVGWVLRDRLWLTLGAKQSLHRSALPSAPVRVRGDEVCRPVLEKKKHSPAGRTHPCRCHSCVARKYPNLELYMSLWTVMAGGFIFNSLLLHVWQAERHLVYSNLVVLRAQLAGCLTTSGWDFLLADYIIACSFIWVHQSVNVRNDPPYSAAVWSQRFIWFTSGVAGGGWWFIGHFLSLKVRVLTRWVQR